MFNLFELINKRLLFPAYYIRHKDPRLKQIGILERTQFLDHEDLGKLSWKHFFKLLNYAYEHTTYYKEVLDGLGKKPQDFESFEDIQIIPPLTKEILRDRVDDLISDKFQKSQLIKDSSGGSTGTPTIVYKDSYRNSIRRADQIRHDRWTGWDLGKKNALLWGAPKDNSMYVSFKQKLYFKLIERNIMLDAFNISDGEFDKFTSRLEKYKPSMILGYANLLFRYAKYLNKNYPTHKIKPLGIVSSAETLTEEMRAEIEKAFHCKVLNRYGSREVGLIASECKSQKGLHINAENIFVEAVDPSYQQVPKGIEGNLLVTDFHNFAMPLIRYELGDVGVLSEKRCDCGRSLPLLDKVVGRKSDFFLTKSGKLIHGEFFTHLFYGVEGIKQFQIVQQTIDLIIINYVETSPVDLSNIISEIKNEMGGDVLVETKKVDHIMPSSSGKFLFTKSNIL